MAETFSDWKLICDEDYRLYGNVDDWGEAAYQAGQASRDDEIREKDKEIERLKAGATLTMYREVVDEADKWRDLADELGEQIRERDSRIATLEKVVEAARTICDATYLHEMINAATDIRKALKELEGV